VPREQAMFIDGWHVSQRLFRKRRRHPS